MKIDEERRDGRKNDENMIEKATPKDIQDIPALD